VLVVSLLILLLAVTSSIERNYNYLADYIKFNRIVFIIFILSGYLAYNTLYVECIGNGIGIYGGVFKITVLSQVFDIILFFTGAVVAVLSCFASFNFQLYNDSKQMVSILKDKSNFRKLTLNVNFMQYYNEKLLTYYEHNNYKDKPAAPSADGLSSPNLRFGADKPIFIILFFKLIKRISKIIPEFKIEWPYLVQNRFDYPKLQVKEYTFLLLFTVLGGSLLISSQNLISLYLSLELQSFTLYILSTSNIKSFRGTSGGLKYFLLGGLSSGFILLGCSLLYAYTGTLDLEHIFMIYSDTATNYFIDPCLLILFAGLLFKVSAAPFHNWAPDVYSDVPTFSTTWLIVIAKLSILILMFLLIHNIHTGLNLNNLEDLELSYSLAPPPGGPWGAPGGDNIKKSNLLDTTIDTVNTNTTSEDIVNNNLYYLKKISSSPALPAGDVTSSWGRSLFINNNFSLSFWNPTYTSLGLWTNILTICAILSLIVGTILGLSQSKIKRLFAYSTIAHVGFLLLALSLNTIASLDAFLFYLIQYTITNLNLFFILLAWGFLYTRYYLEREFIPIRYISLNPFSWDDIYVEPTLFDYGNFITENVRNEEWFSNPGHIHLDKNIKINTIYNHLIIHHDIDYYDFDAEENDWLYTPVPFLINFKGMHSSDPFLAFCLAITIFSLMGIYVECP